MLFLGDIHRQYDDLYYFLGSDETNLIQVGDFGFVWSKEDHINSDVGSKGLRHFEKRFPEKTIFTCLGNHENYDVIESVPIVTKNGGRCYKMAKNVFAPLRGEILNIEGKNILFIGGADSIDKSVRVPQKSWWPQETITIENIDSAVKNVSFLYETKGEKLDCIVSHCLPSFCMQRHFRFFYLYPSEMMLENLYDRLLEIELVPDTWFAGHVHEHTVTKIFDTTITSLAIGEYISFG